MMDAFHPTLEACGPDEGRPRGSRLGAATDLIGQLDSEFVGWG
jgi:hypothetical protein